MPPPLDLREAAAIDFAALRASTAYTPSPASWEDKVLYFLLLDRFSDGNETGGFLGNDDRPPPAGSTPLYDPARDRPLDAPTWFARGGTFLGGTLKGVASKLGYLRRLGVSALWVSPPFKQVPRDAGSYHGYGVQDFLQIDPRYGTREDLRELVAEAHRQNLYVLLDVIFNHAGDVFAYRDGSPDYRGGRTFDAVGFRDRDGAPTVPFGQGRQPAAWPDGAVWPAELHDDGAFTRRGRINRWDDFPETTDGDFFSLKDIHHGSGGLDDYAPSPALRALAEALKFWIAYADVDGFRVDTVKHVDPGAMRFVASVLHEFAQSLGKDRFFLIGEIAGSREFAMGLRARTGLDAALGIADVPDKMEYLVKGYRNPRDYFDLFRNAGAVGEASHAWFAGHVVTLFDDHDQIRRGDSKARFCADAGAADQMLNVLALNALSLGIPCIYYGSEQCLDGHSGELRPGDRAIREAMFGGPFGPFRTEGRHCFDESSRIYKALAELLKLRSATATLRRGRQYLREISGPDDGQHFGYPALVGREMRSVVPWSRLLEGEPEAVVAINTDSANERRAWVTVDRGLNPPGRKLALRFVHAPKGGTAAAELVVRDKAGRSAVSMSVPPAGCVVYEGT